MKPLEQQRLRALDDYGILDTPPEEAFDRLTRLAADLFDAPIALVSLIDEHRQWFKSRHGLDAESTPRSWAFCAHAIELEAGSTLVVTDATEDSRFRANPLVLGDPNIRFYAGALLTTPDGANLGTLCVIDQRPRPSPSAKDLHRLSLLAQVVVDELELRKASRAVKEKQQVLDMAESMAGLGRWKYDVATDKIAWSDEVSRIHGIERTAEPDNAAILNLYFEADRAILGDLVKRAIATGEGYSFQARIRRGDGEVRTVVAEGECQLREDGSVEALYGIFQDVTARVTSERFLRTVADHIPGMLAYWDRDLRCRFANEKYRNRFGRRTDEMDGIAILDLLGEDLFARNRPGLLAALAGQPQSFERTVTSAVGEAVQLWTQYIPDLEEDGGVRGVYVLSHDVTQIKQAETRLQEANGLLVEARDRAEAATAVKSEFLANMSHELRTPLTSIVGFTQLAREQGELSPLTRTYLDRVGDASQALLCTVNDILDFSKLEAGQVGIQPQPTDWAGLCRSTLGLFTPQAGAKDLDLRFDSEPEDVVIAVDADRVRQILLNLVGNAVKFTARGGVTLRTRYDQSSAQLSVEVIDTGPGVAPTHLDRLFKRFSQVDGSLTRAHGGTGLGLAICKGLVEAMGGEIGVDSQLGQGSRFWFRIPARLASGAEPDNPHGPQLTTFAGLRVLVVDDHATNRELARLFLCGVGAEVTEAADGLEAANLALEWPYDVILMDLRMPNLDGVGALRRIREADGPNDATPVLAFSADVDSALASKLLALGFQGVVHKPLEPTALISAVASTAAFEAALDPVA